MSLSFSVLRLPSFRPLLLSRALTTMALVAQAVIVGWQIYSITHDPFYLGLIGLTEAVPAIFCALFAGHIVDISRPYTVYILCIGTHVLNTLMLAAVGGGFITVTPDYLFYFIFIGVFISGLARSFLIPASFSMVPKIVPRKDIPAASSWLMSGFQIAAVGGPMLAGLLYGGYGARGAWFLPVFLLLMAFAIMSFIRVPYMRRTDEKRENAVRSIIAGWTFILKNQTLLSVMALDMFAVLFGGAVAMLPAFADQVLHVGAEGLGLLRAAPGIGAIVMALFLAVRPMKKISARLLLWVVAGFGVCMIGFGLSQSFWLSMLFLFFSGLFDSVSMITRGTLMQLLTPESMRGRVSAVNSMFIISSNEIGAFESGVAARFLGLTPSVVLGGIVTLGVVGIAAWLTPLRKVTVDSEKETAV